MLPLSGIAVTRKESVGSKKYQAFLKNARIKPQWKNNNCGAMNHILKLNQDWKPEKLP
jgi:hypothetical protein